MSEVNLGETWETNAGKSRKVLWVGKGKVLAECCDGEIFLFDEDDVESVINLI